MAAQTGAVARLTEASHLPRPYSRRDRRRRQIEPVVETLQARLLLAGMSPINPAPMGPKPSGTPTPHELGAAYQQVVAIQTTTLQSLGDSYRAVQAADARLASRTAVAITELNADLSQVTSGHEANVIVAAIHRDRDLLDLGGADAAREENGLDVADGLADQTGEYRRDRHPQRACSQNLRNWSKRIHSPPGLAISRSGQEIGEYLSSASSSTRLGDQLTS